MILAFIGVFELIFILLLGLLLPVFALISILRNDFDGNDKIVWVLIVLFLPLLGSILYFLMGRSKRRLKS
ncbi:PLD nuclease N-terminal domain-containing protein [Sunxiuqinia sp. A32]|uniref:PLD nuclease N-terminal domain-containing protein n=1 Tax=Sunxiuqinia sp. A32 TaxID=3461496 RepID=UPI004046564F